MGHWTAIEGTPLPLGVTWLEAEQAFNFALYSEHAAEVTLLLYGAYDLVTPLLTYRLHHLIHKSGRIWHCRLSRAALEGVHYYGYAIKGPASNGQVAWHTFDAEKILLDPYARAVFFPPAFDRQAAATPGSNAGKAPLGLLAACYERFEWGDDRRPHHEADLIIYELHVKGFTRHPNSGVSADNQGTYAGLIEKIPYLKKLGITAVELMPVFQFDPHEGNYWGYMPLSFFAPHQGYARTRDGCQQHQEFRAMVKALHEADIEVILDVVYNHTAESDHCGPVYSYKGIDNSTYYLLSNDPKDPYLNYSGTGNTLNSAHRYVRKMILDSLRYWVTEMHVDGFRFDLASVLARNEDGSLNGRDPPIFGDIASDPDLTAIRLIAEPWDAGGAYQLGRGFPGLHWWQWNGRFRDDVRRFVRGDPGLVPALMSRLYGSDDLFPDTVMEAYHPFQSVNYLTAHDGFTLYDLVTYNRKRNWANGHHNTDGPVEEYSWNGGWEGDEDVPEEVLALRKRQVKNFYCLLFLANGSPMLRAGDEFLQTQGGNNNPYNQDNPMSWIDWDRLQSNRDIFRFVCRLIAFRKAHPSLCRSRFWREDVHWYGVGPTVDMAYESHSVAFALRGGSQGDVDLYVMINGYWEDLTFTVQEGRDGEWRRAIDTSLTSPEDICDPGADVAVTSHTYRVNSRSVVVLRRA